MTDQQFLSKLATEGKIAWWEKYPWSGYLITNTCLILRPCERYPYDWYISTYRFTIVVKSIKENNLAKEWPTNLEELHQEGLRLNEDFSHTPDF